MHSLVCSMARAAIARESQTLNGDTVAGAVRRLFYGKAKLPPTNRAADADMTRASNDPFMTSPGAPARSRLCLLCSLAMAYGWGWRGSYGHSSRRDVSRGAAGDGRLPWLGRRIGTVAPRWLVCAGPWVGPGAGGLSNMEQTFYVVSDSFPDVLWAFGGVFLVGCLWSGMGSAILSLALTRPRSELTGYAGPLSANGLALLAIYFFFLARPDVSLGDRPLGRNESA